MFFIVKGSSELYTRIWPCGGPGRRSTRYFSLKILRRTNYYVKQSRRVGVRSICDFAYSRGLVRCSVFVCLCATCVRTFAKKTRKNHVCRCWLFHRMASFWKLYSVILTSICRSKICNVIISDTVRARAKNVPTTFADFYLCHSKTILQNYSPWSWPFWR